LFSGRDVSVGNEVKGLGEQESYYIERSFKRIDQDGQWIIKSEGELLEEKVVIIEGEPGLGKTIALKHAASELKMRTGNKMWVMEVNMVSMMHAFQA
jgi:MoxR-like ATPase